MAQVGQPGNRRLFIIRFGVQFPGKVVNKVCDIYRMENGMLAEHWDVVQHLDPNQVPANGNGQF